MIKLEAILSLNHVTEFVHIMMSIHMNMIKISFKWDLHMRYFRRK